MAKTSTGDHPDLKLVNPAAAAIDIGSTMHMAAVKRKHVRNGMLSPVEFERQQEM